MTIHGVIIDEVAPWWGRFPDEEESNVTQSKRVGKMKKDAHHAIHKSKVKKKNRAKNRVAKKARKAGRR